MVVTPVPHTTMETEALHLWGTYYRLRYHWTHTPSNSASSQAQPETGTDVMYVPSKADGNILIGYWNKTSETWAYRVQDIDLIPRVNPNRAQDIQVPPGLPICPLHAEGEDVHFTDYVVALDKEGNFNKIWHGQKFRRFKSLVYQYKMPMVCCETEAQRRAQTVLYPFMHSGEGT